MIPSRAVFDRRLSMPTARALAVEGDFERRASRGLGCVPYGEMSMAGEAAAGAKRVEGWGRWYVNGAGDGMGARPRQAPCWIHVFQSDRPALVSKHPSGTQPSQRKGGH